MNEQAETTGATRSRTRQRRPGVIAAALMLGAVLVASGCGDDTAKAAAEGSGTTAEVTSEDATTTTRGAGRDSDETTVPATSSEPLVVPAGSTPTVMAGADRVNCIATAADTGGSYSFLEIHIPTSSGPPRHLHAREDEFFFIISGTASIEIGDLKAEVETGDYFHVPQGTNHSIKATSDVHLVAGYVPGGAEGPLFCDRGE